PDVDDGGQRTVAYQQATHDLDRALRRAKADSYGVVIAQRLEAFEAEREGRASLVACDGVDLVDNDRLDRAQHVSAAGTGKQQIQRLRRGDDQTWMAAQHLRALCGRGVAGPYSDGDRRWLEAHLDRY